MKLRQSYIARCPSATPELHQIQLVLLAFERQALKLTFRQAYDSGDLHRALETVGIGNSTRAKKEEEDAPTQGLFLPHSAFSVVKTLPVAWRFHFFYGALPVVGRLHGLAAEERAAGSEAPDLDRVPTPFLGHDWAGPGAARAWHRQVICYFCYVLRIYVIFCDVHGNAWNFLVLS